LNKVEENNMALFHRIAADYSNKNQGQIQNNLILNSVKNWAGSEFYFVYIKSLVEDKAINFK